MNFTKIDAWHVKSDCGMYVINKGKVGRGLQCYMAVHRGHDILGTWRCADAPQARADAYAAAVAACAAHGERSGGAA